MRPKIIKRIKSAFNFLESEYGFRLKEEQYDPKCFGNALVEYESDTLRVLVTCDRCQFFCYFSSIEDIKEKFDEEIILRYLKETEDRLLLVEGHWESLEKSAEVVCRHFTKIMKMFKPDQYRNVKVELEILQKIRAKELFG